MKNDSHSFLWVPGIKRRVISVGPQTLQQAPLPAEPSHYSDYTVFFSYSSLVCLSLSCQCLSSLFLFLIAAEHRTHCILLRELLLCCEALAKWLQDPLTCNNDKKC